MFIIVLRIRVIWLYLTMRHLDLSFWFCCTIRAIQLHFTCHLFCMMLDCIQTYTHNRNECCIRCEQLLGRHLLIADEVINSNMCEKSENWIVNTVTHARHERREKTHNKLLCHFNYNLIRKSCRVSRGF